MEATLTEVELKQLLQFLPLLRTYGNSGSSSNAATCHNVQAVEKNMPQTTAISMNIVTEKSDMTETMPEESVLFEVECENTCEAIYNKEESKKIQKKENGKKNKKIKHCKNDVFENKDSSINMRKDSSSDLSEEDTQLQSKYDQNRKRMTKFSDEELEVLIREISEKYDLLYGSLASKISNQRKKQIWENIKNKVSSVGVGPRTVIQLKKRWLDIRR
ncbi:hypothetical protein XELAEV_18002962mg [Xenopus laevis]|nr:hypothetical protein XELAEV_18002962mg [Xenopus laevis]